jgi:RNA polymerase sigma-70 factor (ECF subfamily)
MTHFLANEWDRAQAQRRGGGCQILSLDAASAEERYRLEPVEESTPETIFERRWALTVMGVVLDRLAVETDEKRFEALKGFLLEDKGEVSRSVGGPVGNIGGSNHVCHPSNALSFSRALFDEIANTVETLMRRTEIVTCWPR